MQASSFEASAVLGPGIMSTGELRGRGVAGNQARNGLAALRDDDFLTAAGTLHQVGKAKLGLLDTYGHGWCIIHCLVIEGVTELEGNEAC